MNARLLVITATALLLVGCADSPEPTALERGKALFHEGKWNESIASLSEAIRQDPLNSEARVFRGRAYICRGRENLPLAIADYNEAIRINPDDYEAYYNRAIAYKEKGDRRQANADELKARHLDPHANTSDPMVSPALEEYRIVTGKSSPNPASTESATDNTAGRDLSDIDIERAPLPRSTFNDPKLNDTDKLTTPGGSPTLPGARDAYGLPIPEARTTSFTDELLGIGDERERQPKRAVRAPSRVPRFAPVPEEDEAPEEFEASVPSRPARPLSSAPRVSKKPSPVGTLPLGVPFQQPGYSPFPQPRPRSTGFHGDPTLRDLPPIPGARSSYDPYRVPTIPEPSLPDYGP